MTAEERAAFDEQGRRLEALISAMERNSRSGGERRDRDSDDASGSSFSVDMSKIGPDMQGLSKKFNDALEAMQKKFQDFESTVGGFGDIIFKLYKDIEQGAISLAKQTGLFQQASGVYSQLAGQLRGLGMEYSEVGGHIGDLIEKIPEFLSLTSQQQNAIGLQSAKLKKLGVDFQSYANIFVYLTKSQGQNDIQSRKTIDSLVRLGMALGKPPKAIMSEYSSAMDKLAVFGAQSKKVFMESEAISTKLGMSMEKVLGIMDNFNTFEDAADAAGNFNIALGKNLLSTQELALATNPTDRLKMVAKALQEFRRSEGVAFNQLSVQRQRAAATALKIDVDSLSRLDKLNLSNAESLEKRIKVAADGTISYEKNVNATISTVDRLNMLKDQLVSAFLPLLKYLQPILTAVAEMAKMFTKAIGSLGKEFPGFTKVLSGVVSAFTAYRALGAVGITGPGGLIEKFTGTITKFIPFGERLSGFVMPAMGVAFAGLAAKANGASEVLKNTTIGNKNLQTLFGLSDKDVAGLQTRLDQVTKFVRESFDNILSNLGFDKAERDGIIESIRKTLEELYTSMSEIFGKIKEIGGGFIREFSNTMKSLEGNQEKKGLTRIIISITSGLRQVIHEIRMAIAPENAKSVLGEAFDTLGKTFEEFGTVMLGVLRKSFGGLFGKLFPENATAGGGPMSFLSNFMPESVKNWLLNEGMSGVSELLSNVLGGLGSIFTGVTNLMTGSFDGAEFGRRIASIFQGLGNGLGAGVENGGFLDSTVLVRLSRGSEALKSVKDLGAGIKDLMAGLKNVGPDVGQKLKEAFSIFPEIKPVPDQVPKSIKELASALELLNKQLIAFAPIKENLSSINVQPEAANNVKVLADSVKEYVDALTKLRGLSSEEEKIKEALRDLGKAFADVKLEVDAEKIGNKIAQVIRMHLHGG